MITRFPDNKTAHQAAVDHLDRFALDRINAADWQGARDVLATTFASDPTDPVAAQNVVYVYQEWAKARLATDPPTTVLAWINDEASRFPAEKAAIVSAGMDAALAVTSAAVDAKDFPRAFAFASAVYQAAPTDNSRNEVQYVFQELSRAAIAQANYATTFSALADARKLVPPVDKLDDILASVFGDAIDARNKAGDSAGALALAAALAKGDPGDAANSVYSQMLLQQVSAIATAKGTDAAFKALSDAASSGPPAAVHDAVAQFANDTAVADLDKSQYDAAIAVFQQGLKLAPGDDTLTGNLRVAFINASVDAYNAGKFADAARYAAAGLKQFPGDDKLKQIQDAAAQASRR